MSSSEMDELSQIKHDFIQWISSEEAQTHMKQIQNEILEVNELAFKIEKMDQDSPEFSHHVLYGLLPYGKSKYALRVSTFPVFLNIKKWFRPYNYSDEDYQELAKIIFQLTLKVRDTPKKTQDWINNFKAHRLSFNFQCGSITPILFCINSNFPLINGQVTNTYRYFSKFYNHGKINSKLEKYQKNHRKLEEFRTVLGIIEINDWATFDLFCYWFNTLRKRKKVFVPAPKDYNQFIKEIVPKNTSYFLNQYQAGSDTTTINQILQKCEQNKWVLPYFQRYFQWSRTDVKDFLTSIFNDYYVGSFLLWGVYSESIPMGTLSIQGVDSEIEARRVEHIIIDGQQRMTSLYYAMKSPNFSLKGSKLKSYFYLDIEKYFKIISDFKDESDRWDVVDIINVRTKKMARQESFEKLLFPIYEISKRTEWIKEFRNFLLEKSADKSNIYDLTDFIKEKLDRVYTSFSIPYVILPDAVKIYEVTNIFEKINSKGRPLSTFDLLIARLQKYQINLRDIWDQTLVEYPKINEYYNNKDSIPIYLLQTISLLLTSAKSCKKKDLLDIADKADINDESSFRNIWFKACKNFEETILRIENLRDGFGVRSVKEVPFMSMLPILSGLYQYVNENKKRKAECYNKIKMFYWSAVFSNAYSASVDSQTTSDFRAMISWFNDDSTIPETVKNARESIGSSNFRRDTQKSSARYRGVLSLIALEGAKDFDSGLMLENSRANDQHHIFPFDLYKDEKFVNSVLNISWLSATTNRTIGKTKPSEYYQDFISSKYSDEGKFIEILASHHITDRQLQDLKTNNFTDFIKHRHEIIHTIIKEKIGLETQSAQSERISPSEPYSNVVKLKNTVKKCHSYIHWVDKYFSPIGFEILIDSIDSANVNSVKILTSVDTISEKSRNDFKRFRDEMKNIGINAEMRVIVDNKLKRSIHDRWIITENITFNIPSVDTVMRGQYSDITETHSDLPFTSWWNASKNIVTDWNELKRKMSNK